MVLFYYLLELHFSIYLSLFYIMFSTFHSRLSLTTLVPYAGGSNEAVWRREVNRENDSSEAEHTELSHLHVVHLTLPSHPRPA